MALWRILTSTVPGGSAARGIKPDDVNELICEAAEGTLHRLWEPLEAKRRPVNGYAAKFATPFIIATGFVRGGVGLDAFTDASVHDPDVLAFAGKVRYVVDPDNPYPNAFTGHTPRRAQGWRRD